MSRWLKGLTATSGRRSAFTLIELLVVVAIIALLISILLPALTGAREQGKRAKCLANMKNLAVGMQAYSSEDKKEAAIPIHFRQLMPNTQKWEWRIVNWFSFGGRSSRIPFLADNQKWLLRESDPNDPPPDGTMKPDWAARTRPLNRYVLAQGINSGDSRQLEWYHCPSDRGYPDHPDIDDSPRSNANRPCYDTLGNSYRGSQFAYYVQSNGYAFAIGPWGHRISTLPNPARLILFGEPTFFNMIGQDDGGQAPSVIVDGWHRRKWTDNLAFADGSARSTRADERTYPDQETANKMNVYDRTLINRGPTWTFDVWPTPGAIIAPVKGGAEFWKGQFGGSWDTKWPFMGRQSNMSE